MLNQLEEEFLRFLHPATGSSTIEEYLLFHLGLLASTYLIRFSILACTVVPFMGGLIFSSLTQRSIIVFFFADKEAPCVWMSSLRIPEKDMPSLIIFAYFFSGRELPVNVVCATDQIKLRVFQHVKYASENFIGNLFSSCLTQ